MSTGRRSTEFRRIVAVSSYGGFFSGQPSPPRAFVSRYLRPAAAVVVSGMVPLTDRVSSMS